LRSTRQRWRLDIGYFFAENQARELVPLSDRAPPRRGHPELAAFDPGAPRGG